MPLTGPTKKGVFKKGAAWTSAGKLAKVPPVMQATRAPAKKAISPAAEKPGQKVNWSFFPFPVIQ